MGGGIGGAGGCLAVGVKHKMFGTCLLMGWNLLSTLLALVLGRRRCEGKAVEGWSVREVCPVLVVFLPLSLEKKMTIFFLTWKFPSGGPGQEGPKIGENFWKMCFHTTGFSGAPVQRWAILASEPDFFPFFTKKWNFPKKKTVARKGGVSD